MQDGGVASAAYGRTHMTHVRSGTTPVFLAPLLALCTVCSNSWEGVRNKVDYDHGNMRMNVDCRALCVYA